MKPLLVLPEGPVAGALPWDRDGAFDIRRVRAVPDAEELDPRRPTVVVLNHDLLGTMGDDRQRRLRALADRAALVAVGDAGEAEPSDDLPDELISGFIPGSASPRLVATQVRGACRHAMALVETGAARYAEERTRRELTELTDVGVALSTVRNLTALLDMILSQARRITWSDAASLYLVERPDDGSQPTTLRFRVAQNHTLPDAAFGEYTVPVDHASVAGHAASTGELLAIDDVYLLPADVSYRLNRSFDDRFGYRTKSMLVVPMRTHRDEIIGVLQLINRKRRFETTLADADVVEREVLPYAPRDLELVTALAAQAGVAIENSLLYEDIERLFEGFVTAAVTAIESRDPATSGHSGRVAALTVALAEAVNRGGAGPYAGLHFTRDEIREIRYAGLLHDFGKVGVRERVLVKQKKLYGPDLDLIRHRFAYLLQQTELDFERARADYLLAHGSSNYTQAVAGLDAARRKQRAELERFLGAIVNANEPTVLPHGTFEELRAIGRRTFRDIDGVEQPLLGDAELQFLMIRQGNLDERERREIESHVTHTYRFLAQIPWTRELRGVPDIAYGHHEKLDGRGYPRRVTAAAIPVQTRMMTIADIFDALTATDRPYKRAVSHEQALDILSAEAKEGLIDRDLLGTFVEAGVFRAVGKKD
jgi:HD-GYP domain-containing protein (c-di-GMP phosphodiesterase class II)